MKRYLCVILALVTMLTAASCEQKSPKQEVLGEDSAKLIVHFIDVGQGDCTLLESDDEFVLIDAGEREYGSKVLQYITDRGADELKYVIATHPHSDHVGGLRTVLGDMPAENFITVETDCATDTWTKLLDAVDRYDINYIDAEVGDTYKFGKASFTVMGPISDGYDGYNSYSVVTKVECGDISFLLTGDAEKDSESEMADSGEDLTADVLKCGHHGSHTSTSVKFLKAVDPSFAVISCGQNNDYGHPHKETLSELKALGCDVFRTDRMGTVMAYTDGRRVIFDSEKENLTSFTYTAGEKKNDPRALNYTGNKSSRVFHRPYCSGVSSMKAGNKIEFDTREAAVKAGYTPCSICRP